MRPTPIWYNSDLILRSSSQSDVRVSLNPRRFAARKDFGVPARFAAYGCKFRRHRFSQEEEDHYGVSPAYLFPGGSADAKLS